MAELLDDAPEMIDGVEMVVDSSPAPEGARKSRKRKATLGKYKYVDMADEDEEEWLQNIEMGLGFGMQEMEEAQEPLESAEEQGRAWAEKEASELQSFLCFLVGVGADKTPSRFQNLRSTGKSCRIRSYKYTSSSSVCY